MAEIFEFIKILHILAVISWLAGLLYLPRIFVYHTQVKTNSEADKILQTMEFKLLKYIMTPAMIVAFVCGLYLANAFEFAEGWIHVKIFLAIILAGFQGFLGVCRKNFAVGKNKYSQKFYRIINEVPTILMIIIVSLVVLKPF